jgi:hypothetical protein
MRVWSRREDSGADEFYADQAVRLARLADV